MSETAELLRESPAQNLEAERYVISAALLDGAAVDQVSSTIGPDDFYRSGHALVWRTILELHAAGAPTTVAAVHTRLTQLGQLDNVGGMPALVALESAGPGGDALYYAQLMVEAARLRAARQALAESVAILHDRSAPANERLSRVEDKVFAALRQRDGTDGVRGMNQVVADFAASLESSQAPGMSTGIDSLDELTGGLQPGEVTVLGGRPGQGKTSFAMNVVRHQAVNMRRSVLVISLEMSDVALAGLIVCQMARVDGRAMRARKLTHEQSERVYAASDRLYSASIHITHRDLTPTGVRAVARSRAGKRGGGGLDLVVVDYVQLITPDFRSGRRQRHEEVAEMSRSMKSLAVELGIPILCLAALNRQSEARAGFKPRLADLRESGALEADAALVLLIHSVKASETDPAKRDALPPGDDTEIIVPKNRFGPVGEAPIDFERSTGLIGDRGLVHGFGPRTESPRGPDP